MKSQAGAKFLGALITLRARANHLRASYYMPLPQSHQEMTPKSCSDLQKLSKGTQPITFFSFFSISMATDFAGGTASQSPDGEAMTSKAPDRSELHTRRSARARALLRVACICNAEQWPAPSSEPWGLRVETKMLGCIPTNQASSQAQILHFQTLAGSPWSLLHLACSTLLPGPIGTLAPGW